MTVRRPRTGLVGGGVAVLAVLCCAAPGVIAAVGAAGLGAWLAAHGAWLGAGVALVAGGTLAAALRRRRSCAAGSSGDLSEPVTTDLTSRPPTDR